MRVVVTGASGYLGGHVCRSLQARGHAVRGLVRPERDPTALERSGVEVHEGDLLAERSLVRALRGCEGLVHAARITRLEARHDVEAWRVNVDGFAALLRAARAAKVGRIVHVSSLEVLGATRDGQLLDETTTWCGPSAKWIHDLATRKEAEERAFAAAWAGMPVVVANACTLLGPTADGRPGCPVHVLARAGRRWAPPGGTSAADVEDVARGIALALERGRVGERYALGGHNLSWTELYRAFARAAGTKAPRWTLPRGIARALVIPMHGLEAARLARAPWTPQVVRGYGWNRFVDSSKARRELDYSFRPLEESVRRSLGGATR